MNGYQELKTQLLQINQQISSILVQVNALPATTQSAMDDWTEICKSIESQLAEEMVRIAVIGAIKSGKSTLINSLFSGDYLKRGAGVVTAMVTRIRRGGRLKASLSFKSMEEVNSDIERALVLFPSMEWRSAKDKFDIRRESDRMELQQALGRLENKQLISNDTRNLNSLYLSYYLKGFDRVRQYLMSKNLKQDYFDQEFATHRDFSGNEVMALYLKDISLKIDSGNIDENIEIADCQGSDSPNPLHMAMIQDYLIVANLLIYVISSRTGIRQADINFLLMIKKMGLIDHVLFVVNVDFSEHHSLDDLNCLIDKIKEDLSMIKADPEIYAYSALLSLFRKQPKNISTRDRDRLLQWERDAEMSIFSDKQESAFIARFHEIVIKQRHSLLLINHINRLKMVNNGLCQRISLTQDILSKGAEEIAQLLKKAKSQQKKLDRVKSLVKSTLDGALQQIKRNIRLEVDRFFDSRSGEVVPDLIEFIRNYHISVQKYQDRVSTSGFADALYIVFQEFKHEIDTFMAENINPRIFNFIKSQEDRIKDFFDSISVPYEIMAKDGLSEYNTAMTNLGMDITEGLQKQTIPLDLISLKRQKGLELPPASATMSYSIAIKTEAMMRLGVYNIIRKIKQLIRKPAKNGLENALVALKDAVSRMKKETESSIIFHFKNYTENIKFQYIFKLIDMISDHIYRMIMERFYDYSQDLSGLMNSTVAKQVDKEQLSASLQELKARLETISERIDHFHEKMNRLILDESVAGT